MNRYFTGVFVAFAILVAGWLAVHERQETARYEPAPADTSAGGGGEGGATPTPAPAPSTDVEPLATGGAGGGEVLPEEPTIGMGGSAPALEDAPKRIRVGIILVQHADAEEAPDDARSASEARKMADRLATQAQKDFEAAVEEGDRGSTADAGRLFRGILSPEVEIPVFTLDEGEVSDPIETPKGFWIVKRLE